ncbi:uncharacterized protein [Antedon mediterranea]|uniref:uncharacterized protein isoform X1 n=1 Tax=Antedon mediterranea TaxID=105859 RepID=UPI003AF6DAEF
MVDNEFPDTIHTTTTTTTTGTTDDGYQTRRNQGSIFDNMDRAYLRSRPGIINIIVIILAFFYWVILVAADWWDLGFMVTVGICSMIQTGIYFVVFLFRINEKITFIAWEMSEFILHCVMTGLYLLSAILTSVEAGQSRGYTAHGKLVFCTLLAWILLLLYAASLYLSYHSCTAYCQRRSGGGRPATTKTTTTTNTTVMVVESAHQQQYPEKVDPYGPPPAYSI